MYRVHRFSKAFSFSSKGKDEGADNLEIVGLRREILAWWEDMGKKLDSLGAKEAERSDDRYEHGRVDSVEGSSQSTI